MKKKASKFLIFLASMMWLLLYLILAVNCFFNELIALGIVALLFLFLFNLSILPVKYKNILLKLFILFLLALLLMLNLILGSNIDRGCRITPKVPNWAKQMYDIRNDLLHKT